jgi:hypothetical protein
MGAGGNAQEWVDGIAGLLVEQGIVKEQPVFSDAFVLNDNIRGKDGRVDLALIFKPGSVKNMGQLALWRIKFGDISWADDFTTNHGSDYGRLPVVDLSYEDDEEG